MLLDFKALTLALRLRKTPPRLPQKYCNVKITQNVGIKRAVSNTRCLNMLQECIPVGCVPSAAVTVSRGVGVCLLRGGGAPGGVCSGGRGVSALGGCLLLGGCVSAPGGSTAPRGCLLQGGVVSQHALRRTPPPCGQTDACKNITFAISLRTVTRD